MWWDCRRVQICGTPTSRQSSSIFGFPTLIDMSATFLGLDKVYCSREADLYFQLIATNAS